MQSPTASALGPVPLDQSFEWYWMQGWAKARRETGSGTLPMRVYVNGYAYEAEKPFRVGNRKEQEEARKKTECAIPELWRSEWLPRLKQKRTYFRRLDLSALSNDELASVLVEALPWYCECARMHAHLGGTAVEAVGHLVEWYRQRFPDAAESEPYRLVQGQSNLSVEKGHLLWQLQQHLTSANKERLRAALRSRKKQGRWDGLGGTFKEVFDQYLETYWKDSPEILASLVLKYDEQGVEDPHVQFVERQREFNRRLKLSPPFRFWWACTDLYLEGVISGKKAATIFHSPLIRPVNHTF